LEGDVVNAFISEESRAMVELILSMMGKVLSLDVALVIANEISDAHMWYDWAGG